MQIHNYGGVPDLPRFLSGFVGASRFHDVLRIGIVRDAEQSAAGAFQSVTSTLQYFNLPAPAEIGTLSPQGDPHTNILILPENRPGMLETVLNKSFSGTPIDSCIDDFFGSYTVNFPGVGFNCYFA